MAPLFEIRGGQFAFNTEEGEDEEAGRGSALFGARAKQDGLAAPVTLLLQTETAVRCW